MTMSTKGHSRCHGHRRQESNVSMYAMTGLYSASDDDDHLDRKKPSQSLGDLTWLPPASPPVHTIEKERHLPASPPVPAIVVPPLPPPTEFKDCGFLSCRPSGLQRFASIKVFVLLLSVLVTLQQALASGYISSVITTIEKRFEIPSSHSGLIASSYEIGNVFTVIFVSYLGSRKHIPIWIAIGSLVMGIGSMVFMVPHFYAEPHLADGNSGSSNASENICQRVSVREQDMGLGVLSSAGLSSPALSPGSRVDNCIMSTPSTTGPVLIFLFAQFLLGCGGSPLFTLGTTYIDDHVHPESSAIYIGIMYSMAAFGPVCGFLLGAYLLSFHMDSLSSVPVLIDPGDRRFVGMWWGGFFLCGVLLLVLSLPFMLFPKTLRREKERVRLQQKTAAAITAGGEEKVNLVSNGDIGTAPRNSVAEQGDKKNNAKDASCCFKAMEFVFAVKRLLCNPIYIVTCLGACMELAIVSGFVVYLPKYLETQFSLGKSQASVFTGGIAVPGACIGIFLGGCVLKRLQLKPKGLVQFVLFSNILCLSLYALLFFLGCDNVKMAGTTMPYFNSSKTEPFQVNLTASCNFGCECPTSDVEPVCGNNGLTYFSPCHAGCTAFSSRSNYTNCACILGNMSSIITSNSAQFAEVTMVPVATAGPCNSPCQTIFPFLILLFFMTFLVALTQMPLLMIVLRSVKEEERAFALGVQFVIFRLFGYIPAPILFGNLIDSTCLLWKNTCGEKGGRCLLYDIEMFRYKYVGICAIIKVAALILFLIDWHLVRKRQSLDKQGQPIGIGEIIGSIVSIDKLFDERRGSTINADGSLLQRARSPSSVRELRVDPEEVEPCLRE
ncbi:solute carrier organic anion transporter family member 5A1 [Cloeon dipterum]|uniref:solute carrier organic anion transporter family member 5A1 n=1 Tax=Cloeon dipterum TaxID=197152 RepID=UPI0032204A03